METTVAWYFAIAFKGSTQFLGEVGSLRQFFHTGYLPQVSQNCMQVLYYREKLPIKCDQIKSN